MTELSLPSRAGRRTILWLAALALLITFLNAAKPIYIDDAVECMAARQLLHHPLDPFGYQAFWYQWPEPANGVLAPPVWSYWLAGVMKLGGESVLVWKLADFPWILLFVFSLHGVMRRFAGEIALWLTGFCALSPAVLPGINLMLDLPAAGLGLAGLLLAMSAVERRSWGRALGAGVIFALAMQTKYTAAVMPAVALLYGFTRRRVGVSLVPGVVGAVLFSAWEVYVARRYRWSHFLFHLGWNDILKGSVPKSSLVFPLVSLVGGVGAAVGLLAMEALGVPLMGVAIGVVVLVLGYAAVWMGPAEGMVFSIFGAVIWVGVILVAYRMWRGGGRDARFLCLWFGLEVIAYFAISPFAATRRVMDLVLVMSILVGSALARWVREQQNGRRLRAVHAVIGVGIVLGLSFEALDIDQAWAAERGVVAAATMVNSQRRPGEAVWFTGHWGMQFYGERMGFRPVVPDHSVLKRGDWLIYMDIGFSTQHVDPPAAEMAVGHVVMSDAIPLSSQLYGGAFPIGHRREPRVVLTVFHLRSDYVPATTYRPEVLIHWAATVGRPLPVDSIAAVMRSVDVAGGEDPVEAKAALRQVAASGMAAMLEAMKDSQPAARRWTVRVLAEESGDSVVREALLGAEEDPDAGVREAARAAVGGMQRPTSNIQRPTSK